MVVQWGIILLSVDRLRPLKNVQFCLRKAKILSTGIYLVS